MAKKEKTGLELLRELVTGLKLEGDTAKAANAAIAEVETELTEAAAAKATAENKAKEATDALADAKTAKETAESNLAEANKAKTAAEEKANAAEDMLKEAAEQLENTVSTKKGVQKTKVKVGGEEYMVNPLRKITGVPGHGDKVFTGKDVITNAVKVAHDGKDIGLKEYLAATGASILEPSNGRK